MKSAAHAGFACGGFVYTKPFSSSTHDFSSPCPPLSSKSFTVAAAGSRLARPSFLQYSRLSTNHNLSFSPVQIRRRNSILPFFTTHLASNYSVNASSSSSSSSDVDQTLPSSSQQGSAASLANSGDRTRMLSDGPDTQIDQTRCPDVKRELMMLALPALAGQAIDPLAQLMETAYIGRLGTVELASAGVSVSIFNIVSKLFNIPLLSVATSFVAEDISMNASQDTTSDDDCETHSINGKPLQRVPKKKQLSSVSTALFLAVGIGIVEALALFMGSGVFLSLMGISMENPTRVPAQLFLSLRALGAPAVVLSLALQGIFRGFKDTKTPVICLGVGNLSALFLFPLLMYIFQMGVMGAALSTVISQYIVTFLMMWNLNKMVVLLPPKMGSLQFGSYIKSGGFLLGRTLAVLITMTLGTSMAARQGPVAMAAHQICLQVWLAVSLLTDALAASGQAIIAGSLSRKDYKTVKEITGFVLKIGLLTGISLTAILGVTFGSMASFFTKDADVLRVVRTGALFVCASQPFNALAYIFDGLHYGVSDFPYAAWSMMMVGAASSVFLLYAPPVIGFPGVWLGLTLFMALRTVAGFVRLLSRSGPWWFLHRDLKASEVRPL